MDINLELYKVFYYVATSLSFSEASRQLFISQSAVSQSIKTLEKKSHTFYPKHKKSPPHTGRRTSSAACQTGFADARRGRIPAFR